MRVSWRRVWAIARKELAEYRRNRALVVSMAVLPLVFTIQPLVAVISLSESATSGLANEHVLLYMLGIPVLVPAFIAAYAVVGEREQATLEPILTTPIRREEFLLGKTLAALLPSLVIAFAVFALFAVLVEILAPPGVASALLRGPDLIAQGVFTPLLATWSIWVGIGVSARSSDVRVAQQLGLLVSLPPLSVVVLTAIGVIPVSVTLAIGCATLLLILDIAGWRIVARLFDRERLITGTS